ncbi:MAG: endonuclease/exonuclease/phosphatase family protein [Nanoarchaeota archaeon]|nr:endonuclease/exonuclease/phosphatase family protein [Nanoarchaeota archaeon]MBU1622177.1 endonuclease/exonuclease/phosphatase family protein [Nanoarchaeota archaeon]MBU1973992.1 endonuclease/exonuclease/phosphatase family protein [Nanoarchaeota archaeon]
MVKLISYNIEYCEGMEGQWWAYFKFWRIFSPPKNVEQEMVKQLKRLKPDILTLIEVDTGSLRNRRKDEVRLIEKELGMKSFVEKVKYPLNGWLKMFHHLPILNKQANAIISKYQFESIKYHVFHEGTKRMIIEATVNCPKKVTLLAAHLALGGKTRAQQIKELVKIVNNIKNPVILMGDFNTFHGEAEIKELLTKSHLKDKIALDKESIPFTEPAWHPSRRLDYILTSPQILVRKYSVLNFHFSDHLPLMIEFFVKQNKKRNSSKNTKKVKTKVRSKK